MVQMNYKLELTETFPACIIAGNIHEESPYRDREGSYLSPLKITLLENVHPESLGGEDNRSVQIIEGTEGWEERRGQKREVKATGQEEPTDFQEYLMSILSPTGAEAKNWILLSVKLSYHYLSFSFLRRKELEERELYFYLNSLKDIKIELEDAIETPGTPINKYTISSHRCCETPSIAVDVPHNYSARAFANDPNYKPSYKMQPAVPNYSPVFTEFVGGIKTRTITIRNKNYLTVNDYR